MELITNYEPKGFKNIPSIAVSKGVYYLIKERFYQYGSYVDNPQVWSNIRKGLHRKYEIYFYNGTKNKIEDDKKYYAVGEGLQHRIIINGKFLCGTLLRMLRESSDSIYYTPSVVQGLKNLCIELNNGLTSKDYELRMDSSLKDDILIKCRPMDARRSFKSAVNKDFTKEEFIEFIDKNGISEEDKKQQGIKPLHKDVNTNGKVIKFEDCTYQDIHKAHGSFGLDIFKDYTNCRRFFELHLEKAQEAKKLGNSQEAKKHKDYVNMIIGCLGMLPSEGKNSNWIYQDISTRPLYNRCVKITRDKIDNHIKYITKSIIESNLLYANTDGFIMQHPNWDKVIDSPKIGEFGTEYVRNNEVWFYSIPSNDEYTGYSIHQYYDEDGNKQIVGNLPDVLKSRVDLSKGIVLQYKSYVDEVGDYSYKDIKQINVEMETR